MEVVKDTEKFGITSEVVWNRNAWNEDHWSQTQLVGKRLNGYGCGLWIANSLFWALYFCHVNW